MRNGYRVIVDSHVTPSLEVLHRYAGKTIRDRWDEFNPYVREMNSPASRRHPLGPWHTLKVNPIPYTRAQFAPVDLQAGAMLTDPDRLATLIGNKAE